MTDAREIGLAKYSALPADCPRRLRAEARERVLKFLWSRLRAGERLRAALEVVADACNAGALELPAAAWQWLPQRRGQRALSVGTLKRWHYAYQREGIWGLVDAYGNRRGHHKVAESPRLREVVLGCLINSPHITTRDIAAYLQARHAELAEGVSERAIGRYVQEWRQQNAQVWTKLTNPDAWKNKYMAAHGSHHENITRLNQLWELDSTPADWMLADGRHSVVGVIDMYSRRLTFVVSKTSTAEAVGLAFRKAALAWGVPEACRTDNGADYVSNQFSTVLDSLCIDHILCVPFASEQKGTVERSMRTMSHGILDLLPGFIGHNVAERKVIESRRSFAQRIMDPDATVEVAMTAAELQQRLDEWCEHVYLHQRHAGLGCSPFERVQQWREPVRRISDERALDALLMPLAGTRTVSKQGIKLDHHRFVAPELTLHVGKPVLLRRDPADLGRVYVYSADGEFVCRAEAPELLGISRQAAAAAAHHHQKQFLAAQKAELAAARRAVKENIGQAILQHQIATSENLAVFPQPGTDYSTPALEQGRVAASLDNTPTPATPDADTQARLRALGSEPLQPTPVARLDDPRREYQRWLRLDQRLAGGERVSEADRRFHGSYQLTSEWRTMRRFFQEFGLQADAGS